MPGPTIEHLLLSRSDLTEVRDGFSAMYGKGRHRYYVKDEELHKGYEEIPERTYGKMDGNNTNDVDGASVNHGGRGSSASGIRGFVCNDVAVAFVFVIHCEKTKRTAVYYNVSEFEAQDMKILVGLSVWVANKEEGAQLNLTILKGNAYAPWETNPYAAEDDAWLDRITSSVIPQLETISKTHITVTLSDETTLQMACVLVDKSTGKITIPRPKDPNELADGSGGGRGGSSSKVVEQSYNLCLGAKFTADGAKESSARSVSSSLRRLESTLDRTFSLKGYTASLSYNVSKRLPVPPLSDCAREILRSQYLNQPVSRRLAIMRRYDPEPSAKFDRYNEVLIYLNVMNMIASGVFLCDVNACRKMAKVVCETCGGSWACSERHQKEYADEHEEWCKAHRIRI
ncbi:hypothetical protein FRB96_003175 [Tulasnella sp. 330]|nr:hypothetical protein FRB96_003175 [Tulasnella sp. 330]KAG8884812.1 hypothetical protein FRB98_002171 [Tulasnella sp. 332]